MSVEKVVELRKQMLVEWNRFNGLTFEERVSFLLSLDQLDLEFYSEAILESFRYTPDWFLLSNLDRELSLKLGEYVNIIDLLNQLVREFGGSKSDTLFYISSSNFSSTDNNEKLLKMLICNACGGFVYYE